MGATRAAVGAERTHVVDRPTMGGEDFAFYGQHVPACFGFIGVGRPGPEPSPGLHQPDFDFNDEVIATGVELFCRLALGPTLPA